MDQDTWHPTLDYLTKWPHGKVTHSINFQCLILFYCLWIIYIYIYTYISVSRLFCLHIVPYDNNNHHPPKPDSNQGQAQHLQNVHQTNYYLRRPSMGGPIISNANWRRLETVQNILLRTITGSPWFVRNTVISNLTQIPPIQSAIILNSKNMFFKLEHSRYIHLQKIGQIIGPPETNRKRPGNLTRST